MPLVLIFFNTALSTMEKSGSISADHVLFQLSRLIGATPVALRAVSRWPRWCCCT